MRETFEIDGIFINPILPDEFDVTAHEDRDEDMNWWWNKPYIVIEELTQESWIEHYYRLKNEFDWSDEKIGSKEDWENQNERTKKNWLETWPTGFRYNVRCLDGGAWDRSTNKGMFATFEAAIDIAKKLL